MLRSQNTNDGGEGLSCQNSLKCFVVAGVSYTVRTDNDHAPPHLSTPLNSFVSNGKFNMLLGFLIIPKVKL